MTNTEQLFQIYLMLIKNFMELNRMYALTTDNDIKSLDKMFEQANLINETFISKNNVLNKSKEELQLLLETKNE